MAGKISSVAKVAKLALDVAQTAGPLISEYGPAVAEYMKENAPKVKEAAGEAAKTFSSAARRATDTVAEKASQVKDGAQQAQQVRQGKAQEKADAKAQAKAQDQAVRQTREDVLQSATYCATAAEFVVSFEAGRKADAIKGGFFPVPGCFVVLLASSALSKNLVDCQDVYVGSGLTLGEAAYEQLMGSGNPDVYADYKYKKPQHVLFFPCDQADLDDMKASLIIALQAFESYNAREIGDGLAPLREQASTSSQV